MQVLVKGRAIECIVEGPETAPCITLSHGVALDLTMWDPLVTRLRGRYRILRYNSRGHGLSDLGRSGFELSDLAQDVVALLDLLGISTTHYVGLSMGGMVGLGLALHHSDRLKSVAICNARGSATTEYRESWSKRVELVRAHGIEAIVESSIERWFTPEFRAENQQVISNVKSIIRRMSPDAYCCNAAALQRLDYVRYLGAIKVPSLFMTGEQDNGAPPAIVREMQVATPFSRYREIARASHISAMEQPDIFTQAIVDFINEC